MLRGASSEQRGVRAPRCIGALRENIKTSATLHGNAFCPAWSPQMGPPKTSQTNDLNIFLNLFDKVINKLDNYFYVSHLHINNISKIKKIGDYLVPDMIEMTFIRKNRAKNFSSKLSTLPHKLDNKTVSDIKEKFLDKNWYK